MSHNFVCSSCTFGSSTRLVIRRSRVRDSSVAFQFLFTEAIERIVHHWTVSERLFIDESIETTAVRIHTNVGAIYVINSYVRNDSKDKNTPFQQETVLMKNLAVVQNVITTMNQETDAVLVLGDFNLKSVKWKKNGNRMQASNLNQVKSHYNVFIKMMSKWGFSQINSVPNDNGRYLDLIFTRNSATFEHCALSTEPAHSYLPNTEPNNHKETVVNFKFVS